MDHFISCSASIDFNSLFIFGSADYNHASDGYRNCIRNNLENHAMILFSHFYHNINLFTNLKYIDVKLQAYELISEIIAFYSIYL